MDSKQFRFSFANCHLSHQGTANVQSIVGNYSKKKINNLSLIFKSLTEMIKNLYLLSLMWTSAHYSHLIKINNRLFHTNQSEF